MKKQKPQMPHWVALIICQNTDTKKMISSGLAFWAQNRYQAQLAIEGMLPDNPSFLTDEGKLRPYTVLTLKQCKPEEASGQIQFLSQRLMEAMGMATPDLEPLFSASD